MDYPMSFEAQKSLKQDIAMILSDQDSARMARLLTFLTKGAFDDIV